jgi:hypothetical protein
MSDRRLRWLIRSLCDWHRCTAPSRL